MKKIKNVQQEYYVVEWYQIFIDVVLSVVIKENTNVKEKMIQAQNINTVNLHGQLTGQNKC